MLFAKLCIVIKVSGIINMQDFPCSMSMIAVTYSTNPIQNNTPKLDFPHLEATAAVACLPILCLLCRLVKILVPV
jgi:hypothetical protein